MMMIDDDGELVMTSKWQKMLIATTQETISFKRTNASPQILELCCSAT